MKNIEITRVAMGIVLAISISGTMQTRAFAANDCPCFKQADITNACSQGDKTARRLVRDLSQGLFALKVNCANTSYMLDRGFTYPGGSGEPLKAICQINEVRWKDGAVVSTTGGPSSELTTDQTQACGDALENAVSALNLTVY